MAKGRLWTEHELVLALDLYCRTPFGRLHRTNPEIVRLSSAINRSADAVAMKCCNFASLDPTEQARGIRGLSSTSKADIEVFTRFANDLVALDQAYILASSQLSADPFLESRANRTPEWNHNDSWNRLEAKTSTESMQLKRVRHLQSLYRQVVMASYDSACAVCNFSVLALLDAAHIVPWSVETSGRLDPCNGVALCCLHHRAFDAGLMGINECGCICIADEVRLKDVPLIHRVAILQLDGRLIRNPQRFKPAPSAFAYHYEHVFHS